MKKQQAEDTRPPRLRKETLRGLGFAELEEVRGGDKTWQAVHPRRTKSPDRSNYCLGFDD